MRLTVRSAIPIVLLLGCAGAGPSSEDSFRTRPAAQRRAAEIDTIAIRARTYFLASDLLAGRATGHAGAQIAARYIASECIQLGLAPAGRDFLEPVPLEQVTIRPESTRLMLSGPSGEKRFDYPKQFVWGGASRETLRPFAGPAVFVGTAQEILSNRELPPLQGAVAVTTELLRSGAAMERLRSGGAVGMIHLTAEPESYLEYASDQERERLMLNPGAGASVPLSLFPSLPSIVASPELSRELLTGTPLLRNEPMAPARLAFSIDAQIGYQSLPVPAQNVGCLLRGADREARDTAIVLSAHYDHLGIGPPDERGDSIYNGFSDNAAGVAMVLGIAQALKSGGVPLRHSVLLLMFTGEEKGLLGSDYYVTQPSWPMNQMLALVNLDAGAPAARPSSWRIAGGDQSPLGHLAVDIALARGWSATTSPATPNSDYFPFARNGVPAIFIIPGSAPYEGLTADSSKALFNRWDHYHRPADEWQADFPFAGLLRYAEYALAIVRAVDRGGQEPAGIRAP